MKNRLFDFSHYIQNKVKCKCTRRPVIGIPKALFYYEHSVFWKSFFKNLGCKVVISEDTNKEILNYGIRYCSNETCLPVKVFHGHVYSLKDKVDYIFIPRYISVDTNEYTCPKFCGLPDMSLLNLKENIRVLEIKLHLDKNIKYTFKSLKELSIKINIEYSKVIEVFKNTLDLFNKSEEEKSKCNLNQVHNSKKLTISVLGHPYVIYDHYVSMKLIDKLKKRNIEVYTPRSIDKKTKRLNAYPFQGKVFWGVGFENLGSAFTFAEDDNVNGIIYLSPFACGVDAFIIEFIERQFKAQCNYNVPFLKLTIDEHTGEAGFNTRLEAFLDMIG